MLIKPPTRPLQHDSNRTVLAFADTDEVLQASLARAEHGVDGSGLTVAVIDTGIRRSHADFVGRVIGEVNLTSDNGGDRSDASDGFGHGTHIAGVIAASGIHIGVAPRANIFAIKVISNIGMGSFDLIRDAVEIVLEKRELLNISCICLSTGDGGNHIEDDTFLSDPMSDLLLELADKKVSFVASAGNGFFENGSKEGMTFPAICKTALSVGSVYDQEGGPISYGGGAVAFETAIDRIAPYSQRLHSENWDAVQTKIFAPGGPITSTGTGSDTSSSTHDGTSHAAPAVAGAVLLLQHAYLNKHGKLPSSLDIEHAIRASANLITDGDDENDNVQNTGKVFRRINIRAALTEISR